MLLVLVEFLLGLALLLLEFGGVVLLQPEYDGIETGDEVGEDFALPLALGLRVVLGHDLVEVGLDLVLVVLVLVVLDLDPHLLGHLLEDLVVASLVDVVVDLDDVLLLLPQQRLQLAQVLLVLLPETVLLELLQRLLLQPVQNAIDLLPLRRVVRKLFPEDLLVLLHRSVEGRRPLIFRYLLPGRFYVRNCLRIECLHVGLDDGGDGRASHDLPFEGLGGRSAQYLVPQLVDPLDELFPQRMVGNTVESLQVALVSDWPHQSEAFPVLKIVDDGLLDLFGILVSGRFVGETVLEVLSGSDLAPLLVFNLQREVSQHPHEPGHVAVQVLLVLSLAEGGVRPDLLGKGSDHLQLTDGAFVDGADGIVDKVGGYQQSQREYLGIVLDVLFQTVNALGIQEEDVAVLSSVEARLRPHPNSLGAARD